MGDLSAWTDFLSAVAGACWLAAGICLSIAKAAFDSWVFLVEINR